MKTLVDENISGDGVSPGAGDGRFCGDERSGEENCGELVEKVVPPRKGLACEYDPKELCVGDA